MSFNEIDMSFASLREWSDWATANKWIFDQNYITALVDDIRTGGLWDPIAGHISAARVEVDGTNYRESIIVDGCNSRLRAMLIELIETRKAYGADARVYATEAVTPFANRVASLFHSGFTGSEYLPTVEDKAKYPHLRHEDVQALSFESGSLDAYVSCEIFEHIPSIPAALAEAKRVLAVGGILLVMCPFAYAQEQSLVRAVLSDDGTITHLMEPEYHGNPVDPDAGSLVFAVPGWEIIEQCRVAGFTSVVMKVQSSRHFGITGAEIACTFILKAVAA
jgi:SAM-dependent methyltransferase